MQESADKLNDIDFDFLIDKEKRFTDMDRLISDFIYSDIELDEFLEDLILARIDFDRLIAEGKEAQVIDREALQAWIEQNKTACYMSLNEIVENTANGEDGKTEIKKKEGKSD